MGQSNTSIIPLFESKDQLNRMTNEICRSYNFILEIFPECLPDVLRYFWMLNQFLRNGYIVFTIVEMGSCDDLCKKQILCFHATKFWHSP